MHSLSSFSSSGPDFITVLTHPVHVYSIPSDVVPSKAGYAASSWTDDPKNHIFTARLRILETSYTPEPTQNSPADQTQDPDPVLKVDILLEDPNTAALFAAAPYVNKAVVEPTTDSSRFFTLRVQDPKSKVKATLAIGFEERSDAFDFGVALQEAAKSLGWQGTATEKGDSTTGDKATAQAEARDYSLKEGETITINLKGTRFGRRAGQTQGGGEGGEAKQQEQEEGKPLAAFALAPPPPPPPGSSAAREARQRKRLSAQLGFDDGKFGAFA